MITNTKNRVQIRNKTLIEVYKGLELTAIDCFSEGMIGTDVYNLLYEIYGDIISEDLLRMIVNSAELINLYY